MKNFFTFLSFGYILYFFSERVFWSYFRAQDSIPDSFLSILAYGFAGRVVLLLLQRFRLQIYSLFLIGAFYGWIVEGIIGGTLYGTGEIGFPITIAWTGLAWHAFVVVGVYYFLVFLNSSFKKATLFSMVFGLFWGFWSVFWSLEKDPTLDTSLDALIGHSLIYTFFLILSLFVFSLSISTFKPTSFGNWFVVVVLGLYFLVVMVPIAPQSLFILPLLLGLSYIGLRGFGIAHNQLDILKPKKLFIPVVLMMPLFAIVFSVIFGSFQSNLIFLFLSVPISTVCFFVSLYQAYKSYKNPTGEEGMV